jgi:hypothetical protein
MVPSAGFRGAARPVGSVGEWTLRSGRVRTVGEVGSPTTGVDRWGAPRFPASPATRAVAGLGRWPMVAAGWHRVGGTGRARPARLRHGAPVSATATSGRPGVERRSATDTVRPTRAARLSRRDLAEPCSRSVRRNVRLGSPSLSGDAALRRVRPRPLVTLSGRSSEGRGPSRRGATAGWRKGPTGWPLPTVASWWRPLRRGQQTVPDQELVRRFDPWRTWPGRGASDPVLIAGHATSSDRHGSRAGTGRPGPSVFGAYGAQSPGCAAGSTTCP